MAQVFTPVAGFNRNAVGNVTETVYDFSFNAAQTYATGGIAIAAKDVGLYTLFAVEVLGGNAESCKYLIRWDPTNGKLLLFYADTTPAAPFAQVANGTTITNVTLRLKATGI